MAAQKFDVSERMTSSTSDEPRIPRRIIHFWHDAENLPEAVAASIQNTKDRNPGHDHILASDEYMLDFIRGEFGPRELDLFMRNTIPASRADVARLMLLVTYGGVYVDTRIEVTEPIESLIPSDTELLLVTWLGSYINSMLGAAPGSPVLTEVLDRVLRNLERGYFNRLVAMATGPLCLDTVIRYDTVPSRTKILNLMKIPHIRRPIPEVSGSWRSQQHLGIIQRTHSAESPLHSPAIGHAATIEPARLREESEYLAALPSSELLFDLFSMPDVRSAVNLWLTGSENVSWLEHVAALGPFRRVGILTLGTTPLSPQFLKAVGAEEVVIFSSRPGYVEHAARELSASLSGVSVKAVVCQVNPISMPEKAFDLVLSTLCLHRVITLEATLAAIHRSLSDDGVFAALEYVGENGYQFAPWRLALTAALVEEVTARRDPLVASPAPGEFGPLAAVRSSDIISVARSIFTESCSADFLVASLPLLIMMYDSTEMFVEGGRRLILERERALLEAGYAGSLAYSVYTK